MTDENKKTIKELAELPASSLTGKQHRAIASYVRANEKLSLIVAMENNLKDRLAKLETEKALAEAEVKKAGEVSFE